MDRKFPYLGFGLGLRSEHYADILSNPPQVDWFEILTENYLVPGGKPLHYLEQIRERYPIVMHGVSMSLGSNDPLNLSYLSQVKQLATQMEVKWISDHLCWTGIQQKNMHDLLPLPYTEEVAKHVASKIQQAQDFLQQQLLIENVSSYLTYTHSTMSEWEFLREVAERADCFILLDINNIYVSAFNHSFAPETYLYSIPPKRVKQFHLAGHTHHGNHIIDTHDAPIISPVWDLYAKALTHFGPTSTLIERDDHIPEWQILVEELRSAKEIAQRVLSSSVPNEVALV